MNKQIDITELVQQKVKEQGGESLKLDKNFWAELNELFYQKYPEERPRLKTSRTRCLIIWVWRLMKKIFNQ